MERIETSQHLFQAPLYRAPQGTWTEDYSSALRNCNPTVRLDLAAVASYLSFGYVCGDRTMLHEIARRPWLSKVDETSQPVLESVPPHGFFAGDAGKISKHLFQLLCDEARTVCEGRANIYILLSGGLDSRIIAGVLSKLYYAGELSSRPIAITWGLADSRDVVYAAQIAKILGLEWANIPFGPETVLQSIEATAQTLGIMHSPEMLHNMLWFQNIPSDSIVIAGSFGDSIGRAEFMGKRLLQMRRPTTMNSYGIMKPEAFRQGAMNVERDIEALYSRAQGHVPYYARHEHFMQGYRMRGGLCHALSIINSFATIYQMFTAPAVYKFMWALHPTRRDDEIYATLLEQDLPEIARVPWPRTNQALSGETLGARTDLRSQYHEYTKWCSGPLFDELSRRIDPEWFESMKIFDPESIEKMRRMVQVSRERVGRLNDVWIWLAGFRSFTEYLENTGKKLLVDFEENTTPSEKHSFAEYSRKLLTHTAGKSRRLNSGLKTLRNYGRKFELIRLERATLKKYPPVPLTDSQLARQ